MQDDLKDQKQKSLKVFYFGSEGRQVENKNKVVGSIPFYNMSMLKNVDVVNVNIEGMNSSRFEVEDLSNTVLDINITFSGETKQSLPHLTSPTRKRTWSGACTI